MTASKAQRRIIYSKNDTLSVTHPLEEPQLDWLNLPPELLSLVSRKLTDICDFVRFRVVCKRWRSAVGASDLAPQLPWIMDNCSDFREGHLRFYSLLTGKTHTINVPQSTGKRVKGSAYNYLITYDVQTQECSLFNPLTNEELSLPPAPAEPWLPTCVPSGPSPDLNSRYVVMPVKPTARTTHLLFCQLGDLEWTLMQAESFPYTTWPGYKLVIGGFIFCDGLCYANDTATGSTVVINLATQTVSFVVPKPKLELRDMFAYLVVSAGEILRVCWYKKYDEEPSYFDIYRLQLGNRDGNVINPCWIKIDSINHQILFLFEDHGCAFRADDFPGFIGNNIYSLNKRLKKEESNKLFWYDIEGRNFKLLHLPIKLGHIWFVPSLCKQCINCQS